MSRDSNDYNLLLVFLKTRCNVYPLMAVDWLILWKCKSRKNICHCMCQSLLEYK